MFILISKRRLKKALLIALLALLTGLLCAFFKSWDIWLAQRFLPQPGAAAQNWGYELITASFTPRQDGYSVLIDLDSLTLTLYENGAELKSWPVSGGSKEHPSPTGSWIVTDISNWGSGFGGSWIALSVPWGKYGIHGTVEPWAVGSNNISHGCIRMKNADVAELKPYLSWGVPVHIKHDSAPLRTLKDGKIGSDVLRLQQILKLLGYYEGVPDGRFGSGTQAALRQFQQDEKIKADGVAGWHTLEMLNQRLEELEDLTNNPDMIN